MEKRVLKDLSALFGRVFSLLLNRTLMYQASHPVIRQSVADVYKAASRLLEAVSPLVFILDRGQFFIDEEPLDPRINVNRVAILFKKSGIQSISFEKGLSESELSIFAELFSNLSAVSNVEEVKNGLFQKGVFNIKVNHVVFRKVTEDDQVVSREALKKVTPMMDTDDHEDRKRFMETLLESVLTEEFAKTLSITNLMANPGAFSKQLIEVDLAAAEQNAAKAPVWDTPGYGTEVSPDMTEDETEGPGSGTATAHSDPDASPSDGGDGGAQGTRQGADMGGTTGTGGAPGTGDPSGFGDPSGSDSTSGSSGIDGGSSGIGQDRGDRHDTMSGTTGTSDATGFSGGPGVSADPGGEVEGTLPGTSTRLSEADHDTPPRDPQAGTGTGATTPAQSERPDPGAGEKRIRPGGKPSSAAGHGPMLLHQLEKMQEEVHKHLHGRGETSIADLAQAIFEMKKQLLEGIQAQKAIGIAYANEAAITQTANQLADQVMMELIKEEYQAGKVTTQRLAYLIRRIIPEASELKRLLPQIKRTLLAEGMPMTDYLNLIGELRHELQSEELSRIIEESSASIGLDGKELMEEIKRNPGQAAELIYLASEVRKSGGDDAALSDILVEYVEHMGAQAAKEAEEAGDADGASHMQRVMGDIESTILKKLSQMNVNSDVLTRMEQRINERMEAILDNMRVQWLHTQSGQSQAMTEKPRMLTVLQTLEHHVGEDEELAAILKTVRDKAAAGEIEENNFSQIHDEITRQKKILREQAGITSMAEGILSADEVMFIMEKEIARAKRYGSFFSAISLAFVSAKPAMKALDDVLTNEMVMEASLETLTTTFREVDYIGRIGKNKIMVLLPTIDLNDAKKALGRVLGILNAKPLNVNGVPVQLRVAGVAAAFDEDQTPDAQRFAKHIARQLADMVARLKNIQVLF